MTLLIGAFASPTRALKAFEKMPFTFSHAADHCPVKTFFTNPMRFEKTPQTFFAMSATIAKFAFTTEAMFGKFDENALQSSTAFALMVSQFL